MVPGCIRPGFMNNGNMPIHKNPVWYFLAPKSLF